MPEQRFKIYALTAWIFLRGGTRGDTADKIGRKLCGIEKDFAAAQCTCQDRGEEIARAVELLAYFLRLYEGNFVDILIITHRADGVVGK